MPVAQEPKPQQTEIPIDEPDRIEPVPVDIDEDEMPDIVDELAEMNDDELADTVNSLMEQLGPERTASIFQRLGSLIDQEEKGQG